MPIKLLRKIKFTAPSGSALLHKKEVFYRDFPAKHVVSAYVFPCSDLESNQPLFNDGFPSVIFMPNPSDDVHLKRKGKTIKLKSAWVCCGVIKDTHWEIPEGLEYILVLRFKPSSFYSIFNIDPTIFRAQPVCSLQDIVDESWARRIEEMYRKDTVAERITFMSDVLSSYDESNYLPFLLQSAIDYIDERKGNTTVADVLDTLGEKVNHKWLQRNFVKYIGITPKKYISLQRFVYTYSQYDRDKSSDLFTAAITNGYYDYNHFFKDFKQYIGVAPSQYAWD